MGLSFSIAWRYFISRKRSGQFNAVSLISWIALLGYTVGAAALVIVLSVFNGFGNLFGSLYANFDADLKIVPVSGKYFQSALLPLQKIKGIEGIRSLNFVIEENALFRYGNKQAIGTIRAIDNAYLKDASLDTNMVRGEALVQAGDSNFAIVGIGLSYQLGVDPADPFQLFGVFLPRKGTVNLYNPSSAFADAYVPVAGIFSVQDEVDAKFALLPLKLVQEQMGLTDGYTACEIRIKPDADIKNIKSTLKSNLGDQFEVKDRFEQRASFYQIMQSEKTISYFILVFILFIAAFNTIGTLYMMVLEKKKDLNVLNALGLKKSQAFLVFFYESILLAFVGGMAGILMGSLVVLGQQEFGWIALHESENFILHSYPVQLLWVDLWNVFFTLFILGAIAGIYPAYKASQQMKKVFRLNEN
jgi:ABC-type lipoprotein release transport system permease subunit